MRAVIMSGFGERPVLSDVPTPTAEPGQVRVRITAAALNRLDTAIVAGMLQAYAEHRFPIVLGRDGAGVVDEVGDGVEDLAVGDEVVCHLALGSVVREGTSPSTSWCRRRPSSADRATSMPPSRQPCRWRVPQRCSRSGRSTHSPDTPC